MGQELTYDQLKDYAIAYVEAYYDGNGSPGDGAPLNRKLWLALGTVNSGYSSTTDAAAKGARWAKLIADVEDELDPIYYSSRVVGANDFEPGPAFGGSAPNGPARARAWLQGYGNAAGAPPFMSFGSADGCPTQPSSSQACLGDWTQDDYWFLGSGISSAIGMAPQIYSQSQGRQWVAIANTGFAQHNDRMEFLATLTQADACRTRPTDETCLAGADNTPTEGWLKLRDALDNEGGPINQPLGYATDIGWLGDQDD